MRSLDELLRRLRELDDAEPCQGCFLKCERTSGGYQCNEEMRGWAAEHRSSAPLYEEEK